MALGVEELTALRNQPRVRGVRLIEVLAVEEIRGDGNDDRSIMRSAVTLWTGDGHKVADLDNTSLADLLTGSTACRVCGCTDAQACEGGCSWVGHNLCSRCASERLL